MLPVVRIYLKEVGNQLSASTKLLGRAEALKRKGSLGLKWHEMKDAAGIQEACQTVQGMSYLAAVAKPPICETNHDCVLPFSQSAKGFTVPHKPLSSASLSNSCSTTMLDLRFPSSRCTTPYSTSYINVWSTLPTPRMRTRRMLTAKMWPEMTSIDCSPREIGIENGRLDL
jgi:hypothetical protein